MGIILVQNRFLRAIIAVAKSIPFVLFSEFLRIWFLVIHRLIIDFPRQRVFLIQLFHVNILQAYLTHKLILLLETEFFRLHTLEILLAVNGIIVDSNYATIVLVCNSCSSSPGGHIYLCGIDWVIPLSTIILFSGLIPLSVVNLTDSFLFEIGSVNGLGIIVWNTRCFRSACYWIFFMVNEAHEFTPLLVCHLNVLAYHRKQNDYF